MNGPAAIGVHFRRTPRFARLPRGRAAASSWQSIEVDYLFLVGDIVDLWSLRQIFYWPQEHNEVVRAILGKARGRHAGHLHPGQPRRRHARILRLGVRQPARSAASYVHATADGRELLVMHGDEFDTAVKCSRWLAQLRQRLPTNS